jgi:hypothetical protein
MPIFGYSQNKFKSNKTSMNAMKFLTMILVCTLYASMGYSQKVLLKKTTIEKFPYSIYKENFYSHDDNWNAEYFTVYLSGKSKRLCSAYMLAKRNDSTFIMGTYLLFKDRIEFTEHYYYIRNKFSIDSMKTIFYPNKYGNLILKEPKEFKNGKLKVSK